jgi:hypothetical protein
MERLAGCMAGPGCFIARSGEKALPFFKLMKHTDKFEWTPEADKAFVKLKRYLTSPPIMVAPLSHEPLLLYIAATPRTTSIVIIVKREAQVIAKQKVDAPCLGAPPKERSSPPTSPCEEYLTPPMLKTLLLSDEG